MPKQNYGPRLRLNHSKIYEIGWSEGGRSKRRSTGTANLQEAQRVLAGFLLERERDAERVARPTVNDVLDFYETNHVNEKVVALRRQQGAIGQMRTAFGDLFVDEITADDINTFKRKRRASRTPPISDTTIARDLNTLVAAINYAIKNKKLTVAQAPMIEIPPQNPPKDRWLTREEAARLLAAAQSGERLTRVYRFAAIALATAKRRAAIETLKWFQVDFKNRMIDFRRQDGERETKKRRNVTPISDWLLKILERAFKEKTSEYVLDHDGEIGHPFETVCERAGLADVSPHTLRHTWGTWAAQSGKSLWQIAGVMGCSVQTAERNYLHHTPEHLRSVVDDISPAMQLDAAAVVDGLPIADAK